jgi:hypothetical protein
MVGSVIDTALDAFLDRLDRQRAEDLILMAARPLDAAAHDEALSRAAEAAAAAGLERRVADARSMMVDWVIRLFNRTTVQPGWYEANWGRPGTIEDRANIAASLGEAVTAIVLGDRLDPADRDELLGVWAELVDER